MNRADMAGLAGSPVPLPLPLPPPREPWPTPVVDINGLERVFGGETTAEGWVGLEQVLAGMVAVADPGYRPEGPAGGRWMPEWEFCQTRYIIECGWPYNPLTMWHGRPGSRQESEREALVRGEPTQFLQRWSQYPHMARVLRMIEVAAGLGDRRESTPRLLMALPTDRSGQIDPRVLLERLQRAEAEGWDPWPLDFEQALLRLPGRIGADDELTRRATDLKSAAGRRFAAVVRAGGLGPPRSQEIQGLLPPTPGTYGADRGRPGGLRRIRLHPPAQPVSGLHRTLFGLDHDRAPGNTGNGGALPPVTVFPGHREVIAAWALSDVGWVRRGGLRGQVMELMTASPGERAGHATSLLIAYYLESEDPVTRAAGADALLCLATAGDLDGRLLGDHLGALIADGDVIGQERYEPAFLGRRVYPELVAVARAGAQAEVWEVIAAMLPYVLDGKPAGLPDLLALATELAPRFSDGSPIPGLTAIAGRKGSGKSLVQARRLLRAIQEQETQAVEVGAG